MANKRCPTCKTHNITLSEEAQEIVIKKQGLVQSEIGKRLCIEQIINKIILESATQINLSILEAPKPR